MTIFHNNRIVFWGCLWTFLWLFVSAVQAEEIEHNFASVGKADSMVKKLTKTTAETDLTNYTCYGDAIFTSSGSSAVLRMKNAGDCVESDKVIENWSKIKIEYSSAGKLTGSDIGIYIREANGEWQEVFAGVKYRDFSIDAELPNKGNFYLKISNKNGTNFDIRRIAYEIDHCDCFRPEEQ